MEKFAYRIEQLFQEKLLIYKKLRRVLEQEKNYIVDMDVDALWKMADRKKQLASQIEQIRQTILDAFEQKGLPLNMDKNSFSLSRVINSLPVSVKIKSGLKAVNIKLDVVKKDLAGLASENKRYTNEYLSVIKGVFSTITGSQNREIYSRKGRVIKDNTPKHLLRAEV